MAGNVPIFAAEGSHQTLVAGCARHLAGHGALVAGFQLGPGYRLADYDEHCRRAGLACVERWATWSRDPFAGGRLRRLRPPACGGGGSSVSHPMFVHDRRRHRGGHRHRA